MSSVIGGGGSNAGPLSTIANLFMGQPAGASLTTPAIGGGTTGYSNLASAPLRVPLSMVSSVLNGQGAGAGYASATGGRLGTGNTQDPKGMVDMSNNAADESAAYEDGMGKVRDKTAFSQLKNELEASKTKLVGSLGAALATQIANGAATIKGMFAQP